MITEPGRVVVVEDDCLWVETIQGSACASCAAEKGCGQRLVAKLGGHSSYIRVLLGGRDHRHYAIDDQVTIGIPDQIVANSSLVVYMTPLLSLVAGVLLAQYRDLPELGVIGCALAGFVIGALLVRFYSYRHRNDSRFQPFLVDQSAALSWKS